MNRFGFKRYQKRRKGKTLSRDIPWEVSNKETRREANRRNRHRAKVDLRP